MLLRGEQNLGIEEAVPRRELRPQRREHLDRALRQNHRAFNLRNVESIVVAQRHIEILVVRRKRLVLGQLHRKRSLHHSRRKLILRANDVDQRVKRVARAVARRRVAAADLLDDLRAVQFEHCHKQAHDELEALGQIRVHKLQNGRIRQHTDKEAREPVVDQRGKIDPAGLKVRGDLGHFLDHCAHCATDEAAPLCLVARGVWMRADLGHKHRVQHAECLVLRHENQQAAHNLIERRTVPQLRKHIADRAQHPSCCMHALFEERMEPRTKFAAKLRRCFEAFWHLSSCKSCLQFVTIERTVSNVTLCTRCNHPCNMLPLSWNTFSEIFACCRVNSARHDVSPVPGEIQLVERRKRLTEQHFHLVQMSKLRQ
eukprot:comp20306_c0_seq1/m.40479 comp20306_c0_seq1/g.40479  ORF comp20306_c0_seq1/g.40479 comp20306_c0_seq1/m.40479 type:complete len:371 (+) comp20306_c0_seq1:632-1744(+)